MTERVYFLRPVGAEGPIKIGCSRWPDARLESIANWSPVPLELVAAAPGNFKLEAYLHRQFAHSRTHKEWFAATPELLAGVAKVAAGATIEAAFGILSRHKSSRYITKPERLVVYSRALA